MISHVEWIMYVHMTYLSQCGEKKTQTQTQNMGPPIDLGLRVAMVFQHSRTHRKGINHMGTLPTKAMDDICLWVDMQTTYRLLTNNCLYCQLH